jgi:D-alanyl-D-alanine carboxypeptidase/D-alanyl-D-alanine-endopeptidase (penicillin-binding protein 4)
MPVLVVAALLPALLLWVIFRWADGRADAGAGSDAAPSTEPSVAATAAPALNTGLLSFRRAGGELSRDLNLSAFVQGVQPLLGMVNDRSCVAISLDGRLIGERNTGSVVLPASTLKILTAAVALDVLGADFTYRTAVVGPAPANGVVTGDVYLVGGGDPLLSGSWYPTSNLERIVVFNITQLETLAQQLAAAGVTTIQGSIIGDGSRYDDEWFAPGWGEGVAGIEAGPYDALLVNDAAVFGSEQRANDPNEAGADEFRRMLQEQGITVSGGASTGTAPAGASELGAIESQALPAVLAEMLTNSDNNTAELVLKEIGYAATGQGTRQAGIDTVIATLAAWGVDAAGLTMADGSGLSLDNRLTCTTLLGVLQHWGYESPIGAGLAIGGETGTLSDVFGDTTVAGRIRGKTGTLNNFPTDQDPPAVKALAGYMPVEGGEAIEYVLLLNGGLITDQSEYRPIWAALVTALTSYPTVASPAALGPQ